MKRYTIFAGVNGAGKSTFYKSMYQSLEDEKRINTDEMVSRLGSWEDGSLQIKCAKEAISLIKAYFNEGISFNQETTLTGRTILRNIELAKSKGYEVHLYYVAVDNIEIALERIAKRVEKEGGHGVPEADVRRRYVNSFENLSEIFQLCDVVIFCDNSIKFKNVAVFEKGNLVYKSRKLPSWLTETEALNDLYQFYF